MARRASRWGAGAALAVAVLPACAGPDSNPATWVVQRPGSLDADTTSFTAVVTRVGCSSGEQGEPRLAEATYGDTEVVLRFTISPYIDNGTCIGTPGVELEVELDEPLGDRALVDAECEPGSESGAGTTAFCLDDGVRYRPE